MVVRVVSGHVRAREVVEDSRVSNVKGKGTRYFHADNRSQFFRLNAVVSFPWVRALRTTILDVTNKSQARVVANEFSV